MLQIRRYIFVFLILAAACSQPKSSRVLRVGFHVCPATIDPRRANDFVSSTLICLIYEGFTRNLPDGSVELALAEAVDISPDGIWYTFHLRKASWSDGTPITAYDFERSWKQGIGPFPCLSVHLFYPIKYCEAIVKGEKPLSEIGIHALDDHTLQVELERPCPYFLSLTAFPCFLPVASHLIDKDIDQHRPICVNGPFYVETMSVHSSILLKKNPLFWNQKNILLDGIDIQIVPHETTALHLFEQGKLDWIGGALSPLPPDAIESLRQKNTFQISPMAATTFCTFNTAKSPLHNAKIRKALSLSMNRAEIAQQLGQMNATRYLPPALIEGEKKLSDFSYKPLEAKALLKEGLKELGLDFLPPLTLLFRSHAIDKQTAQILQIQWEKILGLKIKLQETDYKTHREILQMRNYDLALSHWIAQYYDPMNILERFKDPKNLKNYPAWHSEHFATQLELAAKALLPKIRSECIEKAEELITEEMPLAPIYHWTHMSLCQPWLHNLSITPTGGALFERAFIE